MKTNKVKIHRNNSWNNIQRIKISKGQLKTMKISIQCNRICRNSIHNNNKVIPHRWAACKAVRNRWLWMNLRSFSKATWYRFWVIFQAFSVTIVRESLRKVWVICSIRLGSILIRLILNSGISFSEEFCVLCLMTCSSLSRGVNLSLKKSTRHRRMQAWKRSVISLHCLFNNSIFYTLVSQISSLSYTTQ